jgi:8-oxo-dGTP diphosphatase
MRHVPLAYTLTLCGVKAIAARYTVGVTGVILNAAGQVLILQHVFRRDYPWGLPGGWVRHNETPQQALRRELLEETGLDIRVGPPLLVGPGRLPRHLETGFLCRAEGETTHLSSEILAARWVDPDALPADMSPQDVDMVRLAAGLTAEGAENAEEKKK